MGGVPGFRDLLPDEAEVLRAAQESVLGEMRRWGYRHVITPMVETTDVLDAKQIRAGEAMKLRRPNAKTCKISSLALPARRAAAMPWSIT